jgi:hypothetical protein
MTALKVIAWSDLTRRLSKRCPTPLLLLFTGIVLRLAIATFRLDRFWPDEHYQTLEPAFYLLNGFGVLSWEWTQGFRSWSLPALHVPPLALAGWLGFPSGVGASIFVRAFYGVADALVWYRVVQWLFPAEKRTLPLSAAMLLPSIALWGTSTLQDHLAMLLFWGVLPLIDDWNQQRHQGRPERSRWGALISGFVLFAIAIPKPQLAVLSFGTALALTFQSNHSRKILVLFGSLGACMAGLAAGLLDLLTVGRFAGTLLQQALRGEQLSRSYGISPAFDYFRRLPELLGTEALTLFAVLLFVALLFTVVRVTRTSVPMASPFLTAREHGAQKQALLLPGVILFVLFHSLIPHKETRFLLPVLPALLLMPLGFPTRLAPNLASSFLRVALKLVQKISAQASLLTLVALALALPVALSRPLPYSSVEVGDLEEWIRRDWQTQNKTAQINLCLIETNWSFLRGSLGLGAPVRYIENDPQIPGECHYAIIKAWRAASLNLAISGTGARQPVARQNDYLLYKF